MPRKDRIHQAVKTAVAKAGWTVTHDPFRIHYADVDVYADLRVEKADAERGVHGDRRMDRICTYRDLIKQYLNEHADLMRQQPVPGLETMCILDEDSDQYLLLNVGWENGQRRRYTTLHARIRNGEIWIEEDWTEEGLANRLLEAGVPKEAIVLAFQSPVPHPLGDYAQV